MGLLLCILRRLKTWAVPLIALVLVIGAFGFVTSEGRDCRSLTVWLDALYRSLQMFGLSFDLDAERAARPNIVLELARYAAGFLIFAGLALVALAGLTLVKGRWRSTWSTSAEGARI